MFMEYLKSIEGKRLYREDKERIKEEFESIGVKLRYIGINTFNGALDDIYKELYLCRFYNKDIYGNKDLVDKRRKLDDGSVNPNRNKKYWILENRKSEQFMLGSDSQISKIYRKMWIRPQRKISAYKKR